MEKLLTIVAPVYKVEKYINKCIESLVVSEDQTNSSYCCITSNTLIVKSGKISGVTM